MKKKRTLKEKVLRLWKRAGLPDFFNKYGPKQTPAWEVYLAYMEYIVHAPSWRRAANFMTDYHGKSRHWTTWHKAIQKWPVWVWAALASASINYEECKIAAIDGTGISRTSASQHYLKRINSEYKVKRHTQLVAMVDVKKKKFLSWRFRAKPRGETLDVRYLVRHASVTPRTVLMDKGYDSNPLHTWLREEALIWSVAPVRKGCRRGRYRKEMRDYFDYGLYWQRNIVECLFGAVKRLFGSHIRAQKANMQRAEISAKLITYNIGTKNTTTFYATDYTPKLMISSSRFFKTMRK